MLPPTFIRRKNLSCNRLWSSSSRSASHLNLVGCPRLPAPTGKPQNSTRNLSFFLLLPRYVVCIAKMYDHEVLSRRLSTRLPDFFMRLSLPQGLPILGPVAGSARPHWSASSPASLLTRQILVALHVLLETDNVAVSVDATHYCVKPRGVMDANSQTSTTALGGCFRDNIHTRAEFLNP